MTLLDPGRPDSLASAPMSALRHVEACNRFDPAGFVPLLLGRRRVGLIRRSRAPALADYPRIFRVEGEAVAFAAGLEGRAALTAALAEVADRLVERGLVGELRAEPFAVTDRWGGTVLFEVDRGAVPFFGTRSYGVHLNGLRLDGAEAALWIGRRSLSKKIAPGKLDNLVAGGISAGYDARETLLKEAAEEAGMPETLAGRARPAGAILYRMEQAEGLRDDVLFVYDLELPVDFVPRNTDGEFESFELVALGECLRRVVETDEFKFNVNLVLIDLALRRGAIGPEHPDYLALVAGLRGGLIREPCEGTHGGG